MAEDFPSSKSQASMTIGCPIVLTPRPSSARASGMVASRERRTGVGLRKFSMTFRQLVLDACSLVGTLAPQRGNPESMGPRIFRAMTRRATIEVRDGSEPLGG